MKASMLLVTLIWPVLLQPDKERSGEMTVGILKGSVTDTQDLGMPESEVLIHKDPVINPPRGQLLKNLYLATDDSGRFEVQLTDGFYDVCVMLSGFTPSCQKVRVRAERGAEVRFRLESSKLVIDEIGTRLIGHLPADPSAPGLSSIEAALPTRP